MMDCSISACSLQGTLKGDFTPLQTKQFFERYDILIHQPNTDSGFSATLFQNKESKEYIHYPFLVKVS